MATTRSRSNWRALESLFDTGALGGLTDRELLECFRTGRDTVGPEAFRILVERHGPMVLGLCRSVVRDPHDADDAFQATFLVLVRKADSIKRRDTIGPWLHGVAGRVARRARNRSIQRKRREVAMNAEFSSTNRPIAEAPSVEEIIQDEIARLPELLRGPLVLCCLEGLSYDLAAKRLGLTEPTLRGRLHRARKQLALRLRGRGITAGAFASAAEPVRLALPALPSSLVESTVQFAISWSSVAGLLLGVTLIPESTVELAQGVTKAMFLQSIKLSVFGAIVGAGALGTMVVAQQVKKAANSGGPRASKSVASTPGEEATIAPFGRTVLDDQYQTNQMVFALKTGIKQKLDEIIDAEFPAGTTLEQLLKRVKKATTNENFPGIPIYVDPVGLQEVKQKMDAPIEFNKKQTSVREVLRCALHPLQLSYIVKDGFLMITSRTSVTEMRVEEMERKLDRVLESMEKLAGPAK